MLGVLLVILAFNNVDSLALGLVLQDIKVELRVSDTQLGFLTGIAFALFYSLMGIPIGRWADRGNRVLIIGVTTVLWSVMVTLCGRAATFLQLVLIRVGVAVGESGCIPPAHSLIADYFSRSERPRAVAIYMMGASVSVVIGYFGAGWINQLYGWRMTFTILGLAGLLPGVLAWSTLREPRRNKKVAVCAVQATTRGIQNHSAGESLDPSMLEVWRSLWRNLTFRHLLVGYSIVSFFGNGIAQWQPAFFVRSYGLKSGELGTWFTLIYGVGGLLGIFLGGEWASRYASNNERRQIRVIAIVFSAFGLASMFVYLATNRFVAFGLMGLVAVAGATTSGPLFATLQTLVPERMRATSISIVYLFVNLIGTGLGPLLVGSLSDLLHRFVGDESLRYALLALCPGYLLGGWQLWQAGRTVRRDIESARADFESSHPKQILTGKTSAA